MDDLSLSNKTIRGLHAMLRQCLEQAVPERLIPYNPANGCLLPKKETADHPSRENPRLLKSGRGMGRTADVLSGTQHGAAARGTGGAAVERPELSDENADCMSASCFDDCCSWPTAQSF